MGKTIFAILRYELLYNFKVLLSRKAKIGLRLLGTSKIVSIPTGCSAQIS